MEDAKITKEKEAQDDQQLYQQGKYPSIIDTDDLVFEVGRQVIGNLNKEKLLDNLLKKSAAIEKTLVETRDIKITAKNRITELELSNKQYIHNNQGLDSALVKVRNELAEFVNKNQKLDSELIIMRKELTESIRNNQKLNDDFVAIRKKSFDLVNDNQKLDSELVVVKKELDDLIESNKKDVKKQKVSKRVKRQKE